MAKQVTNALLAEKLDALTEMVKQHIEQDDQRFQRIFFDNGKPSVFSRLNTLEDSDKSRKWHFRALWVAVMGAAGAIGAALLK